MVQDHVFAFPITLQGWQSSHLAKPLWNFTPLPLHDGHTPPFRLQIRAIVPWTKPKRFYKSVSFPATASAYLCKYGAWTKNKSHDFSLWWWRYLRKSSVNIKRSPVCFRSNNGTMSLHLHGLESLFKSMHNATMQSHLLFW